MRQEEKRIQKEARPWGILHPQNKGRTRVSALGKAKGSLRALRDECCRNSRYLQCGISEARDDLDDGLDSDS